MSAYHVNAIFIFNYNLTLIEYNIDNKHTAGKENTVAESLSINPQESLEVVEEVKVACCQ